MTADPSDPEILDEPEETEEREIGVEAPEADAAEQRTDVAPNRDERLTGVDPGSASEADRIEQGRVVELDEDDYR